MEKVEEILTFNLDYQDDKIIIDFLNNHPQPKTFMKMAILEEIERLEGLEIYY